MSREEHDFKKREDKWSRLWLEKGIFEADPDSSKPKFFITFPFPYMNGSLHLGHAYTSGRLDVIARYMRSKGYNVLYPWAWHWTGEAVMGVVHRLEKNDVSVIKRLIDLDGVNPDEVNKFLDPIYLVKYFTKQGKEDIIRYGVSIDWRREFHTTDLHPLYTKFVEWQVRSLYKKGLIKQSPYPVVWCPRDKSPTGDHDRLRGEGVRPEEYNLIKFRMVNEDTFLVAGTVRPETIFGVTNIWVKDKAEYVLATVDNEKWIVSKECAFKLSHQLRNVKVEKAFKGSRLIGRYVATPLSNRIIPILPADFVDTNLVTGIVYSVPAHAPYDWLALRDLKRNLGKLSPLYNIVKGIQPISIIKSEGLDDYPALEIVKKLNVSSQMDYKKADEATQTIYSREFHEGIMKDNCLDFSGMSVKDAREMVRERLKSEGLLDTMYDLPEEVICRCGTRTIVKIIEDQWALRYSDRMWKNLAREAIDKMSIYPNEAKKLFYYYVEWYRDWPCTRKTGLGTPFPFDKSWIVETLTDSTVYMAFYLIAKYYNNGLLSPDKVDDTFFQYIFYGVGDLDELSRKLDISQNLLSKIRNEFLYWYPVDLRGSGKDLVGNHLIFFIFHHVALFSKRNWPRGVSVNGFTLLNGLPMSKSKGNYISLRKAMELYGADAVRIGLLTIADGLDDPDVYLQELESISKKIEGIPQFIRDLFSISALKPSYSFFDQLLASQMIQVINEIDRLISQHRLANAGKIIFYRIPRMLREYVMLETTPSRKMLENVVETWIKLLSLYAPYISEEVWHEILGKETFISQESWPVLPIELYDEKVLLLNEYARMLLKDIEKISNAIKIGLDDKSSIKIVVAEDWKWRLLKKYIESSSPPNLKNIMESSRTLGASPESASSFGNIVLKQWFDRYAKHKSLLKLINYDDEVDFLKNIFGKYIKAYYPNSKYIVIHEHESWKENVKAFKSAPLIPTIIIDLK